MKKGKIIFLNGVSSAGKTSLALALQQQLDEPYFLISQDMFCETWPGKFWEQDPEKMFNQTMNLMYKTIRMLSDSGKNVILDHVLLNNERLKSKNGEGTLMDMVNQFSGSPVLFVHVVCPIDELRRREEARGDRDIGNAESQLEFIDPQDIYDISVDTYVNSLDSCVQMIADKLAKPEYFSALKQLSEMK